MFFFFYFNKVDENQDQDMETVTRPENLAWNEKKLPFMFLPYHLFAEWTNVKEIIRNNADTIGAKPLTDILIEKSIRKIHRDLHKVNWSLFGLHELKFIYRSERKNA